MCGGGGIWILFFNEPFIDGRRYETADIGPSLERVLRFYTIQGKLTRVSRITGVCIGNGVHPDLEAIGVTRIQIDFKNEEVTFIFEGIKHNCKIIVFISIQNMQHVLCMLFVV